MHRDIRFQIAINRKPDDELTADVAEIEVNESIDGPTSFRVRFAIDVCGDGDLELIDDPRLKPGDPDTEVSVVAFFGGETLCLAHGILTDRQLSLSEGGPGSFLEIQGQDRRIEMDRVERTRAHEGKASEIVERILDSYGFEPDVNQSPIEYREEDHTLNQSASDLAFVTQLAGRNDFRFWLTAEASTSLFSGFEIKEIAHFRPSPPRGQDTDPFQFAPIALAPTSAPELKVNSGDGCSNLSSFEVKTNAEAPNQSGPIARVDADDANVDETEVPETTTEPLGEEPEPTQERTRRVVSAGDAQEAQLRTRAALNDASWVVEARAETTVYALGGIVRAHDVVKLSGAGKITSGDYFVKSVVHHIDPVDHKMSIELLRNALGG